MISLEVIVSGPEIMRKLCDEPEEFAFGLREVFDSQDPKKLAKEMQDYFWSKMQCEDIAEWLRELADAIEEGAEE